MKLRKNTLGLLIVLIVSFGVLMNAAVAASSDETQFLSPVSNALFPNSLTEDQIKDLEAGASIIASYISNGLISQGKSVIDSEKTKEIFADKLYDCDYDYDYKTVYEKLTSEQRVELFISMLCDMVLLNPDTHSGHFGITQDGHLISFNKGHAYSSIFTAESVTGFSLSDNFLSESKIYKDFVQELKNHPEELEKLLNDPRVKEAFLRINALMVLRAERECVKQTLAPLFTFIKQQVNDSNRETQLSNDYFEMLGNISEFLATELDGKKYFPKEEITVKNIDYVIDSMKVVTFNSKANKMLLIAAQEQGFSEGERVDVIAKGSGAALAINGGFFTEGKQSASKSGRILGKFYSYTYAVTGVTVGQNYAFPSAIQKVNNELLSDTSNYLPALGINDSGDIKIGEVKVVWSATRSENGKKIMLERISNIDPQTKDATVYYNGDSGIKEIAISNSKVSSVKTVVEVAERIPNCYQLYKPSTETISEFNSLKVGDYLSYGYELVAAAYSEQEETQDPELSSFFNNCPYVVSGGQLLINNGEVDNRISKKYGGNIGGYQSYKTAICLHKDGMVNFIVKKWFGLSKDDLVERLKEEKCEYAISLDGGGSTTLVVKDKEQLFGFNRVVSDIIAVMPRYSNFLLSQYLKN